MHLSLPASLFTIYMEGGDSREAISQDVYKQFFDMLEPAIGMQVSLGQTNTVALCPAMTTHSELSEKAQEDAGITPTTMRISVGLEDPRMFLAHIVNAAKLSIDLAHPDFSTQFPSAEKIDEIYLSTYMEVHQKFAMSTHSFNQYSE